MHWRRWSLPGWWPIERSISKGGLRAYPQENVVVVAAAAAAVAVATTNVVVIIVVFIDQNSEIEKGKGGWGSEKIRLVFAERR